MASLVVTYPAQDGARFDADYYVDRHIPLVREQWTRHGLTAARALLPEGDAVAYLAVAVLDFQDDAAIDRALGSPEAATVFGDVASFTNLTPIAQRCA